MNFIVSRIFSKNGMIAMNCVIMLIALFSIYTSTYLLFNSANDSAKLDDTLDALAAILVAYGVALEEREVIFKLFNLKFNQESKKETETMHLSHSYGGMLVVLGLMVEVMIELLKIPAHVVDIRSFEKPLFLIGLVFCFFSIQYIYKFSSSLIKTKTLMDEK